MQTCRLTLACTSKTVHAPLVLDQGHCANRRCVTKTNTCLSLHSNNTEKTPRATCEQQVAEPVNNVLRGDHHHHRSAQGRTNHLKPLHALSHKSCQQARPNKRACTKTLHQKTGQSIRKRKSLPRTSRLRLCRQRPKSCQALNATSMLPSVCNAEDNHNHMHHPWQD